MKNMMVIYGMIGVTTLFLCVTAGDDFRLKSPDEIYEGHEISGSLIIDEGYSGDISQKNFPNLTKVAGRVEVCGTKHVSGINLPALVKVGGDIFIRDNTALTQLSFDKLTSAKALWVKENPLLSDLNLPVLAVLGGAHGGLWIEKNMLQTVSFPKLTNIQGNLQVQFNDSLIELHVPLLSTVFGGVFIEGNTNFERFLAPALKKIRENFSITGNLKQFKALLMNSLAEVGWDLEINCEDLTLISMPLLTKIGWSLKATNLDKVPLIYIPKLMANKAPHFLTEKNKQYRFEMFSHRALGVALSMNLHAIPFYHVDKKDNSPEHNTNNSMLKISKGFPDVMRGIMKFLTHTEYLPTVIRAEVSSNSPDQHEPNPEGSSSN